MLTSRFEILSRVKWQLNVATTVLQETFYRVTDLYTSVVNIFLPRDLKLSKLKYTLEARYYAILSNV